MTVGQEMAEEMKKQATGITMKAEAFKALAAAQAEFCAVKMNKCAITKGNKKYKYGDLSAITDATRPALNKHGIASTFEVAVSYDDGCYVSATPVLMFSNGFEMRDGTVTMRASGPDPHSIGSVMTYAKRYAMSAKLNIAAEEDDDGHAGMPDGNGDSAPPQNNRTPRPRTAPKEQSSSNSKIEQFVNGKLNPKYQTANGLLSIQKIKKLTEEVKKKEINPIDLIAFLNKGVYKKTPIEKSYEIRQADFDAIMMIVDQWETVSKKEMPAEVDLITLDQETVIKDKVKGEEIDIKQFMRWLGDYTAAMGDRVEKVSEIHAEWYDGIIEKIDDPIDIMAHGK